MKVEVYTTHVEENIKQLMTTNPVAEKAMRKAIKVVLDRVRKSTSEDIQRILKNDPRDSYKAVKYSVYKKILGGNVSILEKKKKSSHRARLVRSTNDNWKYGRGGNRSPRSARTEQMDTYYGADRGFVLTWLNSGANREDVGNQVRRGNRALGRRGIIYPKNFFEFIATSYLDQNIEELEHAAYVELIKITQK